MIQKVSSPHQIRKSLFLKKKGGLKLQFNKIKKKKKKSYYRNFFHKN